MKRLILGVACALLLASNAGQVQAFPIAFDNFVNPGGLQDWGQNLGMDFEVVSTVRVTELGAFNAGILANLLGHDGSSGVTVGIFDLSDNSLVGTSAIITPTSIGTQINGSYFVDVPDFLLTPGNYSIVAYNDINYNSGFTNTTGATLNDGGGALDFHTATALSRYDVAPVGFFALPTGIPPGVDYYPPVPRFDAGTFIYAVPEPGSLTLWGGLVLVGIACGWRSGKSAV